MIFFSMGSLASLRASHDIWCQVNPLLPVPIGSRRWAQSLYKGPTKSSGASSFSLELLDFGLELSESSDPTVCSSATEPKP